MIQGAQTYEGLDVGGWEVEGGKVSRVNEGGLGKGECSGKLCKRNI